MLIDGLEILIENPCPMRMDWGVGISINAILLLSGLSFIFIPFLFLISGHDWLFKVAGGAVVYGISYIICVRRFESHPGC